MEHDAEPHSSDKEIDRICDDFETAWRGETRPSISDFVARGTETQQLKLFYELLLVDLECRRSAGEQPSREEYLRAHPKFLAQIEGVNFHYGASAFASEINGAREPTPASGLQVGTLVNHFQLVKHLGDGAMGEVWKAWDTRLRRTVAIKLPRANSLSEAELRRFLHEGQAASQLNHPQLASVYDMGRWQGSPYIVVEYVEGENLRQFLDTHRLDFHSTAVICADVAESLQHAHERGVVHRDLKPANIIIDVNSHAHVIDFGLAKWPTEDRDVTICGELLGTPAYMSPELARGEGRKAGPGTDVYSLGVILYEMLTGTCPFQGERGKVLHQIHVAEPVLPRTKCRQIPRDLETICLKALEKDPRRRYTSIQDMAGDLRRFVRGEPIRTRRAGVAEKAWRWLRKRPAFAALVFVAMVLAMSSWMIRSLHQENYQLQGYRRVAVSSEPKGAHVAFVPLNTRTGEPDPEPAGIVQLSAVTPSTALLKPGDYFVESVVEGEDGIVYLDERCVTILSQVEETKEAIASRRVTGRPLDQFDLGRIDVHINRDRNANMVAVPISAALRAQHPILPEFLWVDRRKTTAAAARVQSAEAGSKSSEKEFGLSFQEAEDYLSSLGKRLPSAEEYDALVQTLREDEQRKRANDVLFEISDLPGGLPEWTSTRFDFPYEALGKNVRQLRAMHIIKGSNDPDRFPELRRFPDGSVVAPPDLQLANIALRGVRSGKPRFVKM